jgi:hypothetical protein
VSNRNDAGVGSLRQAIIDANTNPGPDMITFDAATNVGSILLAGPLPAIANTGDVSITGNGAANTVVSGNSLGNVFSIDAGATATISGMTILDGIGTNGGGVNNAGTLTLSEVVMRNNSATAGGGGISNTGTLTLISSIVIANSATNGGGIYSNGGTLTVTNSRVNSNLAGGGGGIFAFSSSVLLINSTLSLNSAASGGGIFTNGLNGGSLTLQNSIIANSTSGGGDCVRFLSTVTAQNSLMEDGGCGVAQGINGNLTGDPALNANLTLSTGSIAIDAGLDSLIPVGITTDLAGNPRIQGAHVDMGAYELTLVAPTPTSTPTSTPTPTSVPGDPSSTPIPTPALAPIQIALPVVSIYRAQPDLIVDQIILDPATNAYRTGDAVQISTRITNIGDATAGGFWVDLYINPSAPPDAANQPWSERCSLIPCYGMAWYVVGLEPGSSIVLNSTQLDPAQSIWAGYFALGTTTIYAYADTRNPGTPTGSVAERNEANNSLMVSGLHVGGVSP